MADSQLIQAFQGNRINTDAAGTTNFTKAGAAASIADVDGTTASVNTALTAIAGGTLNGLTPGAAVIAKLTAVQAEVTALEKATFGTNPAYDTDKNGSVSETEAQAAKTKADTARTDVSAKTTVALTTEAETAAQKLLDAKALVAASGTAAVTAQNTYDAAVATQKTLVGNTAAIKEVIGVGVIGDPGYVAPVAPKTAAEAAEENAVAAAVVARDAADSALKATGAATTYAKLNVAFGDGAVKITDAASLKTALNSVNGTTLKADLIAELQKLPTFGQAAIDSYAKEAAIVAANDAVDTAKGAAILGNGVGGTGYVAAAEADAAASATLAKATAADTAAQAAKVVVDKYLALDTKTTLVTTEFNTFKTANADKVSFDDLTGNAAALANATAKSDVFYFTKVAATDDFNIGGTATTTFGAGDSIVVGANYVGNTGALSTGNNSALEVFFVKGQTGTQVVIETNAVGSATTVVDTNGNVTASPDAAVINLVGVSVEHLSFANGVISYV